MLPSNYDYVESLVERYNSEKDNASNVHQYISSLDDIVLSNVFQTSKYSFLREQEQMFHRLKRNYWLEVYKRSNLEDIISSGERKKIIDSLEKELPEFNKDNVETTVQGWAADAYKLFSEKVDSIFRRLSGDHVTNQPHGFTKKIIYKNLVSYTWFPKTFNMYSFSDYGLDVIHDLRTSIQLLYSIPLSTKSDTKLVLSSINERNEYTSFDNDAFKVKVFKNGNAHIEIHPHVAILLNCELAKLYPNAIPSKHRVKTPEIKEYTFEYKHLPEKTKTTLREFIMYSNITIDQSGSFVIKQKGNTWITDEVKEVFNFLGIFEVGDKEYKCSYNPTEAIRHIIVNGVCDYKSNQFYPTPENIVDDIVEYVGDTTDKRMLEPSAGHGNIANRFETIDCIDKEELNTVILKSFHKNVVCGDFLFYNVKKESEKYDIIVMNPPYSKKQWKTHVEHALSLLNDQGVIYAVLPQGKQNDFENCQLLETYENQFDNTAITTCLYKIKK